MSKERVLRTITKIWQWLSEVWPFERGWYWIVKRLLNSYKRWYGSMNIRSVENDLL